MTSDDSDTGQCVPSEDCKVTPLVAGGSIHQRQRQRELAGLFAAPAHIVAAA